MSTAVNTLPMATLLAWEAVTSLGESARETALLLRAGLTNVVPSRYIDGTGERVMLCSAPALPPDLAGVERVASLAQLALVGLFQAGTRPKRRFAWKRPILLLALPERYASGQKTHKLTNEGQAFLDCFQTGLPEAFDGLVIEVFPFGRASSVPALRRALDLLEDDRLVLWGGVDTLNDWDVLETLERTNRLLTAENVDGVRPGEGAAFLVLGSARARGGVRLLGLGTGREPSPIGSEEQCLSEGLSHALEAAVAPLRAARSRTNCWLLDNSHEVYATQELQNIIARFGDVLGPQAELQMPLRELGDVGAAAMPLLTVLAAEAWHLGFANDSTAVVTGCSEGGARGAMLLAAYEGFLPLQAAA